MTKNHSCLMLEAPHGRRIVGSIPTIQEILWGKREARVRSAGVVIKDLLENQGFEIVSIDASPTNSNSLPNNASPTNGCAPSAFERDVSERQAVEKAAIAASLKHLSLP